MDIQEEANEYAKGRLAKIIERIIADIYSDGYKAGYQKKSNEVDEVVIQKIAEAKAEVARAEAEKEAAERSEALRIAREKAEAERIAQEEKERKVKAEQLALEKKNMAKKKAENDKKDEAIKGVTFKDLGLPSDTLWATEPIGGRFTIELTFEEAKKLYHLPTKGQWDELKRECQVKGNENCIEILTGRGERLSLEYTGPQYKKEEHENQFLMFWLDDEDSFNHALCVFMEYENKYGRFASGTRRVFVGEKLPVIVVKSKK